MADSLKTIGVALLILGPALGMAFNVGDCVGVSLRMQRKFWTGKAWDVSSEEYRQWLRFCQSLYAAAGVVLVLFLPLGVVFGVTPGQVLSATSR